MSINTSTRWQKFLQSLKKREVAAPKKFGKTAATQPEALEGRIAPASLATLTSGTISVSGDQGGAGEIETLVFTVSGGDLHITDATHSITAGSGFTAVSANEVSIALTSLTADFSVNTGTGADAVTFSDALTLPGHVTITTTGGSVTFGNTLTLAANKNLALTAGGTVSLSASASDLSTSGTGAISLTTVKDIQMGSGSSLSTVNGNLTLSANAAGTTSGNFVGVNIAGGLVQATGTGLVSVTGRGGNTGAGNWGVGVYNGGDIIGGTTGTTLISGTGGASSGDGGVGVRVNGGGSSITSNGSAVSVTGVGGGAGASNINWGIGVDGSAVLSAGGTGAVTVHGTGGASAGFGNYGLIPQTGGTITSSGGNVSVTGIGGNASAAAETGGIYFDAATITAGGAGSVTVVGTASAATALVNVGLDVRVSATITSAGGDVSVTATGGISSIGTVGAGSGVRVFGNGQITAGGSGNVTVTGTGGAGSNNQHQGVAVNGYAFESNLAKIGAANGTTTITAISGNTLSSALEVGVSSMGRILPGGNNAIIINADSIALGASGSINSGTATTTINTRTAGTLINIGGADVLTGSPLTLGLTDAELDLITAGTLQIGNASSGAVTVSAAITHGNNLSVTTGAGVTGAGGLTLAATRNLGITTSGAVNLTGAIVVPGTTTVAAGAANNVTFSSASNDFGTVVITSGNNVSLTDVNSITLNASTVSGTFTVTASAGTITTGGAISSVGAISFTANDVAFGGGASSLSGGSTLLLRPNLDASSIGIGASATGTFNLDTTDLAALANGFTGITIGRAGTGTGSVDIRTSSFADDLSVHGGTITVTGLNAGTNNVSLTSTVGPIQNGGDVATDITGGVVTLLKQGATRSADFYGIGGNGGNATITVDATTVSATAQNGSIALRSAGTGGVSMSLNQTNVFGPGNLFVIGATEDVTITSATALGGTFLDVAITGFNLSVTGVTVDGGSGIGLSTVTSGNITLGTVTSSGGPISATAAGNITMNGPLSSATSTALNGVNISGAGNIAATGGTTLTNTGTGTLSGVISGGALTKLGTGTVTLTNANTYTGITTITGGTLQVGNGGTTGTLGAGAVTNNSALVFSRSNSLTIANNISGTGTLNVTAGGITASGVWSLGGDATLTSTAGITFSNTVTMAVNKNLTATATGASDGTISLANSSADLAASGTGTISLTTTRDISLASGASITTVNGALTLSANAAGTGSGSFVGVQVDGVVQATGTGVVSVSGKGGTDASGFQHGVRISNTGSISGGSGAGDKTIVTGQGGISTGGGNAGVLLVDSAASALITSSGGNVVVTGSGGGSGGSGDNNGVSLGYFGGTITAGGTGNVTVFGTGGTASSFGNGLFVFDNAVITSGGGNVTATGVGSAGTAAGQYGVFNTGKIMAGGSGSVVVSGTALSTGSTSTGVLVRSIANISSANGTVQVTGAATSGNFGIDFESGGQIFSGGNQAVTLITDSMRVVGTASISSGTGATTIVQRTAGTSINLGAADVLTGSPLTLGLTDAEFDRITGGTLQIGNASSGAITVSAAISHLNTNAIILTAGTGLNINLNANFTTAGGPLTFSNAVVLAANAAIDTTNAGGTAAGAAVTFSGAIDADAAASNRTLSIAAGTGGAVSFGGAIGGAQAMQSLTVSSAASTSLGAVTTRSGGLSVTASAITLTGNIATDNGGTAGAVSFTGPVTLGANVAFDTDGSTDAGVSFSTTLNSDATPRTLQFTSGGGNVTFSGAVGGTNALQGLTIVSATDSNLGNVTTRNGGISVTSSGNINLSGALTTTTGGTAGAIALTGATRLTGNVSLNTNATTTDAGITISGAVNADAVGNNRTLTLDAGTGAISATGNVGATTNLGTYTITSAASASIGRIDTRSGGVSVTATAITLNGNISTDGLTTAGPATFTGAVTLGAGVTIDTDNTGTDGAISFSSTINGAQSLALTGGAGNVTLSGAVGGTTPLTGVTVTAGDFSATSIALAASGALSITNTGTASTITGAITGTSATLTKAGTGTLTIDYSASGAPAGQYSGGTTVTGGTLALKDNTSGGIGRNNDRSFIGSGALVVTGATVRAETWNPFGFTAPVAVTLNAGAVLTMLDAQTAHIGALTLNGGTLASTANPSTQWGSWALDGDVSVAAGTSTISATKVAWIGARTFTVTGTLDVSGTIAPGTSTIPGFSLVKAGAGTMNLTGVNTYGGTTTVNAGTLRVNGSVTSNVTVTSPGTLGGSGTITGNVSGTGTVAPGNSPGILTISGNFTPTGTVAFEVNQPYTTAGTDYDQIVVGGTVDLSGATLSITGGTAAASAIQTLTLINKTSGGATVASTSPAQGATVTLGSASFKIFYNGGDGNNVVLVDASTPTVVYAEDTTWSGFTNGTFIADADFGTAGNQPAVFGVNAFSTIGAGISAVTSSGQIIVNAGTYGEAVSLNGTKTLTITSSAAVTTNSVAGIAGTTITINGTSLTTGDATNTTFSGIIGGAGALVKSGSGTFTLDGANTFSGGSTLNAGTLQIGSGGTSGTPGTGSITLSGGTLSLNRSDSPTFSNNVSLTAGGNRFINVLSGTTATLSGTVSGGGELWKDGAGTLVLSNVSNTHTNSNVINNGVLEIANFGALGSGNLFIGAGGSGTIRYTGGSTSTSKLGVSALQGTGVNNTIEVTNAATTLSLTAALGNTGAGKGYTKAGAGTLAVTVDVTMDGPVTISAGSLVVGNGATAGSLTASGTAAVTNNGTLTVNRSDTFSINNSMTGSGALVQAGSGTLVLTGTNSYTGTTSINAGILQLGNGGTTGTAGTGAINVTGKLSLNRSDSPTFANAIALQTGGNRFVDVATGTTATLSGQVTGSVEFWKDGAGTLILSNATNAQSNSNVIVAGTIQVADMAAFGTGNVFIGQGGGVTTLRYTGASASTTKLGAFALQGTGTNSTIEVTNSATTLTLAAAVGNSSAGKGFTKTGAGILSLSGANTFDGAVTVSAGVLLANNTAALGTTGGATTVASGAELQVGNGITITGETVTISGGGANFVGALRSASGATATWAGPVILGDASARIGAAAATTFTVSGGVQGSGANQSVFISGETGTGVVVFSAASGSSTYTGATNIIRGTLRIGATDSLPTGTTLDVDNSSAAETATFDLNGFDQTIGALQRTDSGGGTGGSVVTNSGGTIKTLTVNQTATTSYSGLISGNLALAKSAAGTLALTSANTYSGGTTINGGVLSTSSVTGLGTGAVSIPAAGTLTLNSVVASPVYVINGITGTGTINVANLGLGTNSIIISPSSGNLNSFAGTMNLGVSTAAGGGKFAMTAANQMPAAGATVNVLTNATLYVVGAFTLPSTVTLAGGDTGETLGQLRVDSNALVSGNVVIAGAITGAGDYLIGSNTGPGTISGVISESGGSRALTKGGAGTVLLSGANTYTGATTVGVGMLQLGNATALGTTAAGTTVNSGAVLDLNGQTVGAEALTISGTGISSGGALINSSATAASLSGTIALAADSSIGGSGNSTLSGVVSGAFAITKVGAGAVTLSGANTYSTGTTVAVGTLIGNNNTAFGTGTVTLNSAATGANNTSLLLANSVDVSNAVTVANLGTGVSTIGSSGAGLAANATTFSGTITLNKATTFSGTASDRLAIDGQVTGSVGTLTVSGGSRTSLQSTANNFVGNILITGAGTVLQASVGTAGEVIPDATNVDVGAGTTFMLAGTAGATETINSLTGSGTITRNVAGTQTLAIGSSNGGGTFSGTITNGSGVIALTKLGTGTQTISGTASSTNTASGLLQVSGGTLIMGAAFAGDGAWQGDVTINNTATLQLAQGDIFNNAGDWTINTGGTFNMNSLTDTIGNIAGGGAITNNSGSGLLLDDISGTKTFTGTINGTGPLTLRGNVAATGTQEFKPLAATTSTLSNLVVQRGTLVLGGAGTITASGNLSVGQVGATGGNLTIQDTVTVGVGAEFLIGDANTIPGFVTQTGGTVNIANRVRLGHWASPTTSTYTMSGGSLNVTNALNVGWDGSATFTQTGGTVSANGVVIDGSGATATAVETYTLQGGTLNVGTGGITSVDGAAGYALNLGGGTAPVLRATGNFTSGLNATLSGSGANAITVDTNGFTVGLSGVLGGTGGLTKIGANVLTLSGANTYSGATAVNVGTLTAGSGSALGTTAGTTTVASGATLNINGQNLGAEIVNIAGTGVGGLGALVNNGADQTQALRFINLTADATVGGTNRFDIRTNGGGEQLDLAGFTLTKVGTAQFSIVGTTVTNGNLTANAGTLAIETSSTVGGTGTITVNSATLGLYANTGTFTRPIVLNSGATISEPGSGATATVSSPITLNANVAINSAANTTIVLNGVITDGAGTFGYTKGGAGTLTLAGANTYDGTTTVSAGTLQIGNGGTSGSVGTGAVVNNSNLHFKRTDATSFGNTVTGTGTTRQLDGSGQVTITGSVTQANVYAGSGSTAIIAAANPLVLSGTSVLNVSGTFGGTTNEAGMGLFGKAVIQTGATLNTANLWLGEQTGRTGEVQQDGGAVTVSQQMRVAHWPSNTSTYTINGGTLTLTGTPAGGTEQNGILYVGIDGTGVFNQTGGTVTAPGMVLDNRGDTAGTDTYTMTGGTLVLGSFGISGNASTQVNLQGGTVRASASFTASLPVTFTGGSTTVDTNGFDITLSNTLSGSGNFNKINGGTLNISGTSAAYAGTGSMAAGTTNLTGTLGTSATFAVNGGTLIGTGTVGTLNVNTGGTVNPGTVGTVGTLNTGTLNFNGGTYGADLIGTAADKITASTAVNLNGGSAGIFTLNNAAAGVPANTVFTFIDNTSAGAISNQPLTNAAEGGVVTVDAKTARYTYLGGAGGNDFTLTVDGSLTIVGTAAADNFEVRRIVVGLADNIQVLRGGVVIDSRPTASFGGGAALTINAGGNNDNLFVNYGASGGIYNFDINYNGEGDAGAPGDSVTIGGASVTTVTHNFINNNDGNIVVLDGAGTRTVNYTGLEPIVDNLNAVNRVFVFSGVTETISLTSAGAGISTIDSNVGGESVTFANPTTTLLIDGGAGDDTMNITSMGSGYTGSITVDGSGNTDSITITAGLPVFSSATFTAETINAATLTTSGNQTYNGPVLLSAATTLTSNTGSITITGTTNGAQALSLSAVAGNINLASAVGGVTPLTSLTTSSATITALPAITAGALSITATAGGVSGANDIIVSGATSVTAAGAITLNGAANDFQGTVSLSATAAGAITVTDSTGGLNIASATTTDGAISLTATSGDLTATSVTAGGAGRNIALTTVTSGNVLVDNVTAAGDTVTINSVGTIQESGADAGADITANSLSLTAATGIGSAGIIETAVSIITGSTVTGGIDLANTGALSITSLAASTSGNITLTNTGSIALAGNVSAASGNVSLTSTANITRSAGTVSGTTVTFTATAGTIGASGAEVNTSATSLIVASGGNQFIIEANGANVTSTATAGNITLTTTTGDWTINSTGVDASGTVNLTASAGDILRSGVAADITGTTLTLTAGGADGDLGASGNALLTSGTSIVFTGTGTGDVFITEANGANVTGSTGSGNITLVTTTGDWTVNSTGVDTTGNVTMNASAGDILRSGAAADITGNTLSLNAGNPDGDLGASGNALLTSGTTISFSGAGTGDVFITESNGASVTGTTGSGNITLVTTTGDWTVFATGISTTGNVALTASAGDVLRAVGGIFANISGNGLSFTAGGADGDVGTAVTPLITTATSIAFAGAGTGDVFITESNGASFSGSTGSGNITLISTTGTLAVGGNITTTGDVLIQATAGAITRTAGTVSGDDLFLTAGLGIGASGAAVETSVATIVTTSTADQFINEANGVAANLLNAGAANITLTLTAGALTDNNAAAVNFSATNLTLVAPAGITGIETTVTTLTASTTNSDISITETNNVALNLVDAGTGDVFLSSGGSVTDNNAGASNVNATALTISAATGIDIDTTVTTLDNGEVTSAGNLRIDDLAGGLNVTLATTAAGTLTITATGGNLFVDNADSADALTLQTITSGDIRVDSVFAATTATLISVGRVDEFATPDVNVDITAETLSISAVSGIGTNSGGALETEVSFLNATTNTGGIFIDNFNELEVTGLTATTSGNIVLNNYGEEDGVSVTVVGDITISGPVSTSGNVTIISHEVDDNVGVPPPYTNNVTVTSTVTGNVVTLRAGDDLTISSTGVVTSTGLMTLEAGYNDVDSYGNVVLNGTINPGGGLILISYGDIVFGPPAVSGQPVINAPGVPVTLTTTTGNIYDNNDNDKPAAAINGPAFGGFVVDVVASVLTMNAPAGYIGEDSDTIESTVATVIANAGNGGVFLWNTAALTVAAVTTSGATVTAVDITSQGSMTINGPVSDDGEEDINFFATGVASDLTLVGSVSGSGNMNFDAGNRVILGGSSSITNGSAVAGVVTVALNAGWPNQPDPFISNPSADLTLSGPLNTGNANVNLTAPRHVILNGGNADITTNGSFSVNADRDSSAVGIGGTFQQIGLDSTVQAGSVEIIAADVDLGGTIDAGTGDIDVFASRTDSPIYIHNTGAALNISLTDLLALRTVGGIITLGESSATATVFLGGLGTVGVGLVDANYTINGGAIDFNGGIVLHDNRILALNATLSGLITTTGGGVTDVVIGGSNGTLVLDSRGDVTLNTRVTNLGTSQVDNALVLNNTNTDLTITGDVTTESADITVGTGTLTVDAGFTLASGVGAVGTMTITADGIALDGELDGGGVLTLRGNTVATTFGFGNGATGMFNMDIIEIGNITDGFEKIVIGRAGQTGDMEFLANVGAEVTFVDPVQVVGGTSDVTIRDGKLVGEDDASFDIVSGTLLFTGTTPGITTEDQHINITSATTLASDTVLDTNVGAIGSGGDITMIGTVNGTFALNINAADAAVSLLGNPTPVTSGTSIGGNTALDSITVTGGLITLRPNITTLGNQDYTGSAIRIADGTRVSVFGDLTFNGPVTVEKPANNVAGGDITFNGDVNSGALGNGALGLKAVNVTFNNSVGDITPLAYVSVTASGTFKVGVAGETFESKSLTIKAGEVDFLADVSVPNGTLSIEVPDIFTAIRVGGAEGDLVSGAPTLNFSDSDIAALQDGIGSIIFGRAAGDQPIVIAEAGPVTFLDAVTFRQSGPNPGKVQILGSVIGDTSNGSITTLGKTIITGDVTTLDGGKIDISNGLVGADVVLDSSAGGGDIFLRGSWAATVAGSELFVSSGAGDITITGAMGLANGKAPALGLVTLDGSGTTTFGASLTADSLLVTGGGLTKLGGAILTVGADGQIYDDAVQLAKTATITSKHANGIVQFNSTVDSIATKFNSISVTNRFATAGTSAVEFNGAVGATQRLGTFRIYTKGDSIVDGSLFAKSVSITSSEFTVNSVDTAVADSVVNSQTYLGAGNFLGAITSERLTVTSTAEISNNAPWRVSGLATISTSKLFDVTLTNGLPKNQFGDLIVRGRNVTVEAEGSINFRGIRADATASITTDGNITQTGGITAQSFDADTAGNIVLTSIRNAIAAFTDVTAGGTLSLVSANATTVLLDGVLTSGSGDVLFAATAGSVIYSGAAAIASASGDWTIYSTLLKYPSYDLQAFFSPDVAELGTYPAAPSATGKVVVYRFIGA